MARLALKAKQKTIAVTRKPPKPPAAPNKVGRPSLFTPEIRKLILESAEIGSISDSSVADYCGISYSGLRKWLARGEQLAREHADDDGMVDLSALHADDRPFVEFVAAYKRARAKAMHVSLGIIRTAGVERWQAHAWWLERREPETYALRNRWEVSGPNGGPIQTQNITDADRERRLTKMRERMLGAKRASA